jgi:AcrR family transcriptional regulator
MKHGETKAPLPRKTGRPLSFDRNAALEQAMLTFWRHGYETTSIADLTTAMGITPPSLYTAFGDKKRLFLEAVKLYAGDPEAMARSIADAPSAYDAVRDMLTGAAEAFTSEATPPGCLLASATASGSTASADVQKAVAEIRRTIAAMLRARIARDIKIGKLPGTADSEALAHMVIAVIQGMSVLARDGIDRAGLCSLVDTVLTGWPCASVPN